MSAGAVPHSLCVRDLALSEQGVSPVLIRVLLQQVVSILIPSVEIANRLLDLGSQLVDKPGVARTCVPVRRRDDQPCNTVEVSPDAVDLLGARGKVRCVDVYSRGKR